MISETLFLNQINYIDFVLVNAGYTEVSGLGAGFNLEVAKHGAGYVAGLGVKAEIGSGAYRYSLTAAECNTIGPLMVRAWGAGTIQQNLEYVVQQRNAGCIPYTYVVTNSVTLLPESGVDVWITVDIAGTVIIWRGRTDAFGVARDINNILPCLDAGTYFFFKQKVGFLPDSFPDSEVVS